MNTIKAGWVDPQMRYDLFEAWDKCAICRINPAEELMHGLAKSKNNIKRYPVYISSPFNCYPGCGQCHDDHPSYFKPSDAVAQVYERWLQNLILRPQSYKNIPEMLEGIKAAYAGYCKYCDLSTTAIMTWRHSNINLELYYASPFNSAPVCDECCGRTDNDLVPLLVKKYMNEWLIGLQYKYDFWVKILATQPEKLRPSWSAI